MGRPFPQAPAFTGYNAPSRIEADIFDLTIEGELPAALEGVWYRMTPDPQFAPLLGDDFFISGDGMISLFRFGGGHVDYRSRYVRTPRLLAERKARRALFGAYRNPFTDDPSVAGVDRTVANTSPVWHGGRLLAIKEDGLPYEIDPDTLATRGRFDWNGRLRSRAVSAHPKIDPRTGELLFYGYEVDGDASRTMAFCVADAAGDLLREEWFEAPYAAMVHDFAITEDYVVFPLFPTIADLDRMKAGGPHWMSDVSRDAYIGVMPRRGSVADLRWFRRRGGQAFHVINAWNEGECVYLDLCLAEMNPFPYISDVSGAPYDPQKSSAVPTRLTLDLAAQPEHPPETVIAPVGGDVPRINDAYAGRRYRYAYMGLVDASRPMPLAGPVGPGFNVIGRLDVASGEAETWYGEDASTYQEPQFVPAGPHEGDGYLLCVIERHDEHRSDVGVFDAKAVAAGPIALIRLPLRLRSAIHGTWVPKSDGNQAS
jgi:carotenoid cleavage dioxygenase-like enzyme